MEPAADFAEVLLRSVSEAPTWREPVTAPPVDVPADVAKKLERARKAVQDLLRDREVLITALSELVEATRHDHHRSVRLKGEPDLEGAWRTAEWLVRSWRSATANTPHATPAPAPAPAPPAQ